MIAIVGRVAVAVAVASGGVVGVGSLRSAVALVSRIFDRSVVIVVVILLPVAIAHVAESPTATATSTTASELTRRFAKGVGELFLVNKLLMGDEWSFVVRVSRGNNSLVSIQSILAQVSDLGGNDSKVVPKDVECLDDVDENRVVDVHGIG